METQTAVSSFAVESGDISSKFDDDGRKKRTGIYIYIYMYLFYYSFYTYNSLNFFLPHPLSKNQ